MGAAGVDDAGLAAVAEAWPELSPAVRREVLALVRRGEAERLELREAVLAGMPSGPMRPSEVQVRGWMLDELAKRHAKADTTPSRAEVLA